MADTQRDYELKIDHLEEAKFHLRRMPYGDFMKLVANAITPGRLWLWIHN